LFFSSYFPSSYVEIGGARPPARGLSACNRVASLAWLDAGHVRRVLSVCALEAVATMKDSRASAASRKTDMAVSQRGKVVCWWGSGLAATHGGRPHRGLIVWSERFCDRMLWRQRTVRRAWRRRFAWLHATVNRVLLSRLGADGRGGELQETPPAEGPHFPRRFRNGRRQVGPQPPARHDGDIRPPPS